MKVVSATLLLLASAEAFNNMAFGVPRAQYVAPLSAAAETATSEVQRSAVRKAIMRINKDNFSETLAMVEPFLVKESGITFYDKSMNRIKKSAKALGVEVPANFAKEAKATEKRRSKQDAFIQAKIEEARAAEEAAQEAARAAEAAAQAEVTEEVPEPVAA